MLIVDDYPAVRKALGSLLEKLCSVVCIEATNGLDAIAKTGVSRPDLIILDLGMRGMDGFETPQLPISITAHDSPTIESKRRRWEYAPCFPSTRASTHLWHRRAIKRLSCTGVTKTLQTSGCAQFSAHQRTLMDRGMNHLAQFVRPFW